MSIGGELEIGSWVLEVRRVRCRYVNGGFRMVIVLCASRWLVSTCAACGNAASAETDVIASAEW